MQEIETQATELTAEEIAELVSDAPAPNNGEAFCPTDAAGVDWVLGKMADHRARAQRIRENAELMARAEERKVNALEWKYGAALQTWLRAELEGGKRKSVRLYNGCLGLRTKPAGVHVTDPAAALGWAKEHLPGAVLEALDKKALSALLLERSLMENGEAVPFAEFQAAEDLFYIK